MKESIIKKAWSEIGKHRNRLRNKKLSPKRRSEIALKAGMANKRRLEIMAKSKQNAKERLIKLKVNKDETARNI